MTMIDMERLKALALETGFSYAGSLDTETIELKQEVRDMCSGGNCGQYGKRWSCPPGCGEINDFRKKISMYRRGVLVQTVGQLEDQFDVETMIETQAAHKENMDQIYTRVLEVYPKTLAIGAGCCTICDTCTYPDKSCRFPDRQMVSMEACGMVVSEVCLANGMQYYYGPGTIAYTSCFLLE